MNSPDAARVAERAGAARPRPPAQQPGIAFALAALTSVAWGLLPLALRTLVPLLDSYTITCLRFGVAAIVVGLWLAARGELPDLRRLQPRLRWLLAVAVLGLTINYVNFVKGVELTTPAIAQTVTQLSNIFLLLGGLVVFRERFAPLQWLGFALLMAGLALFFNHRLPQLFAGGSRLTLGVGLLTVGSLAWACYGLIQKRLLREYRATQLLWLFYVGGTLVLLPFASPLRALGLQPLEAGALVFCILNTIVGYGAYAEAMRRGEVARVSATVTTAPLFTLAAGWLATGWAPSFAAAEQPNGLTILGACLVVAGCALCALGATRRPA
jgi:drug/metabolite transporter (DMT)-like permease